jgi:hypothetical protein
MELPNNRAFAYLITERFLHKALVSIRSIKQFSNQVDFHIAYYGRSLPSSKVRKVFGDDVYWHLKGEVQHFTELYKDRPIFVLELFKEGYELVCHIGADVVAYQDIARNFFHELTASIHSKIPLDEMLISTHQTGLLAADLTYWKNCIQVEKFLNWQYKQLCKVNSDKDGHFFDQVYLDFAITSLNVKLLNPSQFGKAYYNLHEGFDKGELKCFHFSGFLDSAPSVLTKYRVKHEYLTADVIALALDYGKRIYDAKEEINKANKA